MRLDEADLVVMESTYGDRLHRSWEETWKEMGEIISGARRGRGNILIPSFAVGRAQELLYAFGLHFHDWGLEGWDIFLDSPIVITSYSIHYTKLYEAAGDAGLAVEGGCRRHHRLGRRQVGGLAHRAQAAGEGGDEADDGADGEDAGIGAEDVITSYSIHYTKLYEGGVPAASSPRPGAGWRPCAPRPGCR